MLILVSLCIEPMIISRSEKGILAQGGGGYSDVFIYILRRKSLVSTYVFS